MVDQISDQSWQSIVLAVRPAVFNDDVTTFDKAGLTQSLVKRAQAFRKQSEIIKAAEVQVGERGVFEWASLFVYSVLAYWLISFIVYWCISL